MVKRGKKVMGKGIYVVLWTAIAVMLVSCSMLYLGYGANGLVNID